MDMGPSLSPPTCSFCRIDRSSQGHQKGHQRRKEEVRCMGGAPASCLSAHQQWWTLWQQHLNPTQMHLFCLTTGGPTHHWLAPP